MYKHSGKTTSIKRKNVEKLKREEYLKAFVNRNN